MSVSISGAGSISGLDQGFNVTTGSVGIGTDVPQGELHVKRTTSTGRIIVEGAALAQIGLRDNAGGTDNKVIQIRNNAQNLLFGTQTDSYQSFSEKVRIDSNGYLGLNNSAPHNQYYNNLVIGDGSAAGDKGITIRTQSSNEGVIAFSDADSGAARYAGKIAYNHGSNAMMFFTLNGDERLRITSSGNVGINESSPGAKLDVANGTSDGTVTRMRNDEVGIVYGVWGTGSSYPREASINGTRFDSGSSPFLRVAGQGGIKFCVDLNNERMRIQPSGYVGIGEDAPGGKLTVKHANTATSGLNATLKLKQGVATNGNRSSLIFSSLDDFDVAAVNGVVEVHSGTSSNNVGRLEFWTKASGSDAAERLRISSDGKVCVGTTLTNYGVLQIRDASGDSTTSAIQVENASSGNSTTNVILRSVSLNSGAWANAEYRAKSHVFSYQTTPVLSVLANFGPWAEGNKGTTRGTLHLKPGSTDHMGGAITFGASDSGSGETAMAGIYTRSDGNYGTKMYFATTDSYATGPKNAMAIDQYGYVTNNKNPSFLAYNFTTRAMGNNLVAASTYHNTGNNYSTSTGIFTAPVAGHYLFSFALLHSNSPTTYARVLFRYNGNYTTQYGDTLISEPGSYVPTSASVVFYMNVNDTMQLFNEGNNVYDAQYGSFSGHFLG